MVDPAPLKTVVARRSVLRWIAGSGFLGAIWGTGFTALGAYRQATATIAGDNEWQVLLFESGRSRAVVLLGTLDEPVGNTLSRMMGSFRQRIDLVIGDADALTALPADYRSRWQVLRTIVLGSDTPGSRTARTISITAPTSIALGTRMSLLVSPMVERGWSDTRTPPDEPIRWVVTAQANGAIVRFGARLEDIGITSPGPAAVTVAPAGDPRAIWSFDAMTSIAVNNSQVPRDLLSDGDAEANRAPRLVSVFPDDLCRLTFIAGGVRLPYWARSVRFRDE